MLHLQNWWEVGEGRGEGEAKIDTAIYTYFVNTLYRDIKSHFCRIGGKSGRDNHCCVVSVVGDVDWYSSYFKKYYLIYLKLYILYKFKNKYIKKIIK
jgi:hypothetical protein